MLHLQILPSIIHEQATNSESKYTLPCVSLAIILMKTVDTKKSKLSHTVSGASGKQEWMASYGLVQKSSISNISWSLHHSLGRANAATANPARRHTL